MESVLIIDDDNSIVHILKDIIEAHFEELCVSVATSGKEGIEKIEREQPELVLLDYLLPDWDGLEVLRNIDRRNPPSVIMISEVSDKKMMAKAYLEDIAFFITKPINVVEVVSVVRRVMKERRLVDTFQQFEAAMGSLRSFKASSDVGDITKLKRLFGRLGILGSSGCDELIRAVLWAKEQRGEYTLNELYGAIVEDNRDEQTLYALKKRIRRVVTKAFRSMAALGVSDPMNPTFEELSGQLFDYAELHQEIRHLKGQSGRRGKVHVKQFIESSMVLMDKGF